MHFIYQRHLTAKGTKKVGQISEVVDKTEIITTFFLHYTDFYALLNMLIG